MTKEDVLALLEKSDAPVSGEQMCRALGMTRAGVWKAIEALRADGFDIEAAPRRGYRLCAKPLQKQALERLLDGRFPADRLIVLPEVDSTNTYLKQLASNGAPDETAVGVLIDCLTLWINNLMYHLPKFDEEEMKKKTADLLGALEEYPGQVVLVLNEVGLGIVPGTPEGRVFRDCSGRCGQMCAAAADEVWMCVCGIPLKIKG